MMKVLRVTLSTLTLSVIVAGCGGASTGSVPLASTSSVARHATSSSGDLIYTDDEHGKADVLTFDGHIVARFLLPHGGATLCSDSTGDVWAADTQGTYVTEYTHGGTTPVTMLSYEHLTVIRQCSVDPTTGNLVICSGESTQVAVFAAAQGSPTYISTPLEGVNGCTYDASGNLYLYGYVDAKSGYHNAIAVLPKTNSNFALLRLTNDTGNGIYLLWTTGNLYLANSQRTLFRIEVGGSTATEKQLPKDGHRWGDIAINGSALVGPYLPLKGRRHLYERIGLWPFPKGGPATSVFNLNREDYLVGITVSVAQTR